MSVSELEKAISELPSDQLTQFATWFEIQLCDEWDKQIERDEATGKFGAIIKKGGRRH